MSTACQGTIRDREFHDSSFDQHFPRRCRTSVHYPPSTLPNLPSVLVCPFVESTATLGKG